MKRVCVFCGSKPGRGEKYLDLAFSVGELLAQKKVSLVYGGASVGTMGALAEGHLKENGTVIGVIPKFLEEWEVAHQGLSELIVVENMHQRKAKMYDLSDAFMILPGGLGTWDEMCEVLTWLQLGRHEQKVGLLNAFGFYDPFLKLLETAYQEGFVGENDRNRILVEKDPEKLIARLLS